MTNEQLFALACEAIDDADVLQVLEDAIEARGELWREYTGRMPFMREFWIVDLYAHRARAIAAVLLFESWPATQDVAVKLPVIERAARGDVFTRAVAEVRGIARACVRNDECRRAQTSALLAGLHDAPDQASEDEHVARLCEHLRATS